MDANAAVRMGKIRVHGMVSSLNSPFFPSDLTTSSISFSDHHRPQSYVLCVRHCVTTREKGISTCSITPDFSTPQLEGNMALSAVGLLVVLSFAGICIATAALGARSDSLLRSDPNGLFTHTTEAPPSHTLDESVLIARAASVEGLASALVAPVYPPPVSLAGRDDSSATSEGESSPKDSGSAASTTGTPTQQSTAVTACAASGIPGRDLSGLQQILSGEFKDAGMGSMKPPVLVSEPGEAYPTYCNVTAEGSDLSLDRCVMESVVDDFCYAGGGHFNVNSSWPHKTATKGGRWMRYHIQGESTQLYVGLEIDQTDELCKNHMRRIIRRDSGPDFHCKDRLQGEIVDRCE